MARYVLVPGFWLGAWAWDEVADRLRRKDHDVVALTLPGLESASAARDTVSLDDHIAVVVEALDAPGDPVVLVGHSGAGVTVYGATDRRPDRVQRGVYVDCLPLAHGMAVGIGAAPDAPEVALPSWDELAEDGVSIEGLSTQQLARFRERAVPQPAGPGRDPLQLTDLRRRQVPVTLISCEIPAADIEQLTAGGHPYFAELAHLDVTVAELRTGHWPMWSRPDQLTDLLIQAASD